MKKKRCLLLNSNFLVFFFSLLLLTACNENKKNSDKQNNKPKNLDSLYRLRVNIDSINLGEKATQAALEWEDYMATQTELEQWKGYQFTEIISNADNLQSVTDSLRLEIPKAFDNKPIKARLKTIATQADMLYLYTQKSENHQAMYNQAQSIVMTFIGLKRQMNEVFIKEFSIEE